jgi:DNA-binding MarR family transcriptional regulator
MSDPRADTKAAIAASLERLLPRLWDACFTPLPPGPVAELPVGQARTLVHLQVAGRRRMGELADDLGVRLPTASRIVDRLVARGLVARVADPDDRRVVRVEATPTGIALAQAARSFRRAVIVSRLERLDDEGRAALLEALALLEKVAAEPVGATR